MAMNNPSVTCVWICYGPKSIPKTVVFAGESEQAMLHSSQHRSDTGGDLDHRTLYRPVQNQMHLLGAKAIHRRIQLPLL
jgi:hypothetical protein